MSGYIKREDALKKLCYSCSIHGNGGKCSKCEAYKEIQNLPSADVVEAYKLIEFLKHMAYETAINCVGGGAVKAEDVFSSIAEYRLDLWYEAYKAERGSDD